MWSSKACSRFILVQTLSSWIVWIDWCLNSQVTWILNTKHELCQTLVLKRWFEVCGCGVRTVLLTFSFFSPPHFSQLFSSYNPGAPVGDWLLMSSGVRFTAVWTRTPTLPLNRWTSGAEASPQRPLDTVGLNSRRLRRAFQRLWMVVGGGERCAVMMWARVSPTPSDWSAASAFDLAKFPLKLRVNDEKLRLPAASGCE